MADMGKLSRLLPKYSGRTTPAPTYTPTRTITFRTTSIPTPSIAPAATIKNIGNLNNITANAIKNLTNLNDIEGIMKGARNALASIGNIKIQSPVDYSKSDLASLRQIATGIQDIQQNTSIRQMTVPASVIGEMTRINPVELSRNIIADATLQKLATVTAVKSGIDIKSTINTDITGTMYYATNDLLARPALVKQLLEQGKITQAQLDMGGVPSKQIFSDYLEYASKNKNEKTMTPKLDVGPKTQLRQPPKGKITENDLVTPPLKGPTQTKEPLILHKVERDNLEQQKTSIESLQQKILYKWTDPVEEKQKQAWVTPEEYKAITEIKKTALSQPESLKALNYDRENMPANVVEITNRAGFKLSNRESADTVQSILNSELNFKTVVYFPDNEGYGQSKALEHRTLAWEQTMGTVVESGKGIEVTTGKQFDIKKADTEKKGEMAQSLVNALGTVGMKINAQGMVQLKAPEKFGGTPLAEGTLKGTQKQASLDLDTWNPADAKWIPSSIKGYVQDINNIFTDTEQRLEQQGLAKHTIVDGGKPNDWSLWNVLGFYGKILQGATPDLALNGVDKTELESEGISALSKAATEWATTGKVTGIGVVSGNDLKTTLLQYGNDADIEKLTKTPIGQREIAKLNYDPFMKVAIDSRLGPDRVSNIASRVTLTQTDIEEVNRSIGMGVVSNAINSKVTGIMPVDIALTIATGGIIGVEGKVVSKGVKTAERGLEGAKDLLTFAKDYKLVVPTEALRSGSLTTKLTEGALNLGKAVDTTRTLVTNPIINPSLLREAITDPRSANEVVNKIAKSSSSIEDAGRRLADMVGYYPDGTTISKNEIISVLDNAKVGRSGTYETRVTTEVEKALTSPLTKGELKASANVNAGSLKTLNDLTVVMPENSKWGMIANKLEEANIGYIDKATGKQTTFDRVTKINTISDLTKLTDRDITKLAEHLDQEGVSLIEKQPTFRKELQTTTEVANRLEIEMELKEARKQATEWTATTLEPEEDILKEVAASKPPAYIKVTDPMTKTERYVLGSNTDWQKWPQKLVNDNKYVNDFINAGMKQRDEIVKVLRDEPFYNALSTADQVHLEDNLAKLLTGPQTKADWDTVKKVVNKAEDKINWQDIMKTRVSYSDVGQIENALRNAPDDIKKLVEDTLDIGLDYSIKTKAELLPPTRRLGVPGIEAKKLKTITLEATKRTETIKPTEGIKDAISAMRAGNLEKARSALTMVDPSQVKTIFKGNALVNYKDVDIGTIMKLAEKEGVDSKILNTMARERSIYATEELSKKAPELKKIMSKVNFEMPLQTDELRLLWKPENRDLAMDALWHEQSTTLKETLPDRIARDITERMKIAKTDDEFRKAVEESQQLERDLRELSAKCNTTGKVCGI